MVWISPKPPGSKVQLSSDLEILILVLSRSKRFMDGDKILDAQSFMLFVFVNDLENQDVDEGSDGVEHM